MDDTQIKQLFDMLAGIAQKVDFMEKKITAIHDYLIPQPTIVEEVVEVVEEKPREQYEYITPEQLEYIEHELRDDTETCQSLLNRFKISTLAELPKSEFLKIAKRIQTIKIARNK